MEWKELKYRFCIKAQKCDKEVLESLQPVNGAPNCYTSNLTGPE
jgi:hypothetical protein